MSNYQYIPKTKEDVTTFGETEIENVSETTDPFWSNDISIIFRRDRIIEFVPTKDMTNEERLNAISRFSLYVGTITSLYYSNIKPMYISMFIIGLTFFVYNINEISSTSSGSTEGDTIGGAEGFTNSKCTKPTVENPFMNLLNYEIIDNPTRGEACQVEATLTDPGVKDDIEEKFNINIYKDVSDIFNRNNSQRQFYTMPSTTWPNKQGEFAEWCYGNAASCKDDMYDCYTYDDIRRQRFRLQDENRNPVGN